MAAIQLGEVFMFPVDERPISSALTFVTAWRQVDFSSDVPSDTAALLITVDAKNDDGKHILAFSEDNTTCTPAECYQGGMLEQQYVTAGNNRSIRHLTTFAPGGKFYVGEYGGTWDTVDAAVYITVLGYYLAGTTPVALTSGSDWDTSDFKYSKIGNELVLDGSIGLVNNATAGDVVGTLPVGYRPSTKMLIPALGDASGTLSTVNFGVGTDGIITILSNTLSTIHCHTSRVMRKLG